MWISKPRYTELIKAETRADWLTHQVNRLELDLANARSELTGKPQSVPLIQRENTPRPVSPDVESFEDMGDDNALKHGARWDDGGQVYYQ